MSDTIFQILVLLIFIFLIYLSYRILRGIVFCSQLSMRLRNVVARVMWILIPNFYGFIAVFGAVPFVEGSQKWFANHAAIQISAYLFFFFSFYFGSKAISLARSNNNW